MDRKLTTQEIKQIELSILTDVANYCNENNIHCSLAFGTLLGAVRHNGFIPWDDDIDIAMPREEYEWFMSNYKSKEYEAVNFAQDPEYPYAFGKVMDKRTFVVEQANHSYQIGVYIDVFPVDGLPEEESEKHRKKCEWACRIALYKMVSLKYPIDMVHTAIHTLIKIPLLLVSQKTIIQKQTELATSNSFITSKKASILTLRPGCKIDIDKDSFLNLIDHQFEQGVFKIPANYHELLQQLYGDYMTPPPVEKRTAHFLQAYLK